MGIRAHFIKDFCRYLSEAEGFDDRLGLVVFENRGFAMRCLGLMARRLGAVLEIYRGGTDDARLRSIFHRDEPAVVALLDTPPSNHEFESAVRRRAFLSREAAAEKPLVLAISKECYRSLPHENPLRRIGCCLQLERELFEERR